MLTGAIMSVIGVTNNFMIKIKVSFTDEIRVSYCKPSALVTFPVALIKCLRRKSLKGERLYFGSQFQIQFIIE